VARRSWLSCSNGFLHWISRQHAVYFCLIALLGVFRPQNRRKVYPKNANFSNQKKLAIFGTLIPAILASRLIFISKMSKYTGFALEKFLSIKMKILNRPQSQCTA
jgi:hypothetical protein